MPPMKTYIEIMVGNGGILRHLLLPDRVIINDIDPKVFERWRSVKLPKCIKLYNQDGIEILKNHCLDTRDTLIYCDPPYQFSTRKGGSKPLYRYEWTNEQHEEFLTVALTAKCNVVISHVKCDMYERALKGWYTHDFQSMTSKGLMWDRIWMNYPPPVLRQDYRYLGSDYREREIIGRKVARWINRLHQLPQLQQIAILSALLKEVPDAMPIAMQFKDLNQQQNAN